MLPWSTRINRRWALRGTGLLGLGAALGWRPDRIAAQDDDEDEDDQGDQDQDDDDQDDEQADEDQDDGDDEDEDEDDDDAPSGGACARDPRVGDSVTLVGSEGGELAVFTTDELIDEFEDFDESAPPPTGSRYVAVRLAVEVTGRQPFGVNTFEYTLQDVDGFAYTPAFVTLPDDADETLLENVELAAGDEAEGLLLFQVLANVQLARLFYSSSGRLLLLADLRED